VARTTSSQRGHVRAGHNSSSRVAG
jgi:hypothetical protein